MNTIIICLTVILTPIIRELVKKQLRPETLPILTKPTPYDALKGDLGGVFCKVFDQLRGDFKGDAFPKKVFLSNIGTWTPRDKVLPIVVCQLERLGWIVWQDSSCLNIDGNIEIIVDVPRSLPKQIQTSTR